MEKYNTNKTKVSVLVRWFGYQLAYSYGQEPGNRFRLGTVTDSHHRVAGTGTPQTMLEDTHSYGYDADGNRTVKQSVGSAHLFGNSAVQSGSIM